MSAYLIADVEILDSAGYEDYRRQVTATITAFGGRYLVRGGAHTVLEGDWSPKRCVILEFPNMAQLEAWYDSPAYVPLRAIRERTTKSRFVKVEGL
jgi:uncharacterized protein (DUF1330 family)